ncbi:MAG: cyclic nucleotide-binding domain-containing protein [Anaerolineae bacterium]|nr:cyclic nucleotide-binding domain-containing protein [Anaerolineae bacterium]
MDSEKKKKALSRSSWFRELPEEVLDGLVDRVDAHVLQKGDVLIRKNDLGDSVFMIYSGWVKIVVGDVRGEEVVLNHLGPGEFVGEISLIDQRPRSASVIALSPLEALELKRDDFIKILNKHPEIALYVIINISERMRFSSTYVEKAIQWSQRVADGDYGSASDEIQKTQDATIVDTGKPDDVRANRFLSSFFRMVEGVKAREEKLMSQLHQLTIEIDQVKRDEELDSLVSSEFFQKIKADTQSLKVGRRRGDD